MRHEHQPRGPHVGRSATRRLRLGLALGGGGVRGAVHIGVLQALHEHGLEPDCIAGTSVGSLVGGLYAFGRSPTEIRRLAAGMHWRDIRSYTLSKFGLLSNHEIATIVREQVGEVRIEDAPTPLAVLATDISTGEAVVLRSGDLAETVMASTCMPGYYIPTAISGRLLVDGGLVVNVPVSPLLAMGAEVIVAVELNAVRKYARPKSLFDVLSNAFGIAMDTNTRIEVEKADVVIGPDLSKYEHADGGDVWELYAEGYRHGVLAIKQIRAAIEEKSPRPFHALEQKLRRWRRS